MFDPYLSRWALTPDGAPITTHAAFLLPVRRNGGPAMLKIARNPEERRGGVLMDWWEGEGAAHVFAIDGDALLMERATGSRSLADYARTGRDEEATHILCDAAARLHAPRPGTLPELVPLDIWFRALAPTAATHGGLLSRSAAIAHDLLANPQEVGVLHGDIHHGNVLDFGERGWKVIDPKGLFGERGFDYANIFTNPDFDDATLPVATRPEIFSRRLAIISEHAGIDRRRLLQWIIAWTGLSSAWVIGDNGDADIGLRVSALAIAEYDR
jgi:streptomycin 6-kinase